MITNLMRIRQAHDLTSRQVANAAGLTLSEEYNAEIGGVVEGDVATRLADALSTLSGETYSAEEMGLTPKNVGAAS